MTCLLCVVFFKCPGVSSLYTKEQLASVLPDAPPLRKVVVTQESTPLSEYDKKDLADLFYGCFPDLFLFGCGAPKSLHTSQEYRHEITQFSRAFASVPAYQFLLTDMVKFFCSVFISAFVSSISHRDFEVMQTVKRLNCRLMRSAWRNSAISLGTRTTLSASRSCPYITFYR